MIKLANILNLLGIKGTNGSAIASATNPVDVRPSADGTNPVDATHGLYVRPGTSSLWDVFDRAARLIGALTGINGSSVATGANPVPVQMSDGAAVFTAAKASTQTDGTQIVKVNDANGNLCAPLTGWPGAFFVSPMLFGGSVAKASPGVFASAIAVNGTPGTAFLQVHNAATAAGISTSTLVKTSPASAATSATAQLNAFSGGGLECSAGIVVVWSTAQFTYVAVASNTGGAEVIYR